MSGSCSVEIFSTYNAAVDAEKDFIKTIKLVYGHGVAHYAEPVLTSGLSPEMIYSPSPRFAFAFFCEKRDKYCIDSVQYRAQFEAGEQEFRIRAARHIENGDASCA